MWEYPTGTQRFTIGGELGTSGRAKYVYNVSTGSSAGTGGVVTLHNGTSAGSTANIYAIIECNMGSGNITSLDSMYFPNGCYVHCSANSGVQFAVIQYQETNI
jgi:hypothetical protein